MNNAQANINTSDCKPSTEELIQQTATVRWPTPVRPVSQLAPAVHHTAAPTGRQTRSRGPMEITSLFNHPSPPDAIHRKPATMVNPVNTFTSITNDPPSQEDIKVASITGSTRLYKHLTGTGSGLTSGLGIQSENSAFSTYLRDSRMQPSELYIPDGSGDTRTTTRYGHLHNGHEASVVKIELFVPYFDTDRYVINHHNGDVYLWDRESNNIEPLALQVGTTPLSVDTAKMLTQTTTNTCQLTMQNRSQSHSSSRSSLTASRASARTDSCNSCYRTPHDPCWINAEDLTLENTLHNISINPSTIDGPADGAIFKLNHLAEIVDIWSKLIWNLAKVGKTYHHLHAQFLNPSPEELENILVNCEKGFNSHLHHILHLDDLLARDARHHIQLRYHVINYPRYIPTMVELCRSSFSNIIDKLKADLAYFKDDFWNKDMFDIIHKPTSNKSNPRTGHGASMPKPLDIPLGSPGTTTTRGNPPWVTPVPPPKNHSSPTSKPNTCSIAKVNPHWSIGQCICASTMTSTPTKNNYIIQKSASTTATTSACSSTKTQW